MASHGNVFAWLVVAGVLDSVPLNVSTQMSRGQYTFCCHKMLMEVNASVIIQPFALK